MCRPVSGLATKGLFEILYYVNFIVFIIFDMHFHYYMCVHKFGMLIIATIFVKLSVYIIGVVKMLKVILLCACCYFIVQYHRVFIIIIIFDYYYRCHYYYYCMLGRM